MNGKEAISDAVDKFLSSCPNDFDFPAGGTTKIPLESELKMAKEIQDAMPLTSESLVPLRERLTIRRAYQLIIFAVRMAVLAARTGAAGLIDTAIYGLVIENGLVDWRDTLRALSIIEDCAKRLGIDFQNKIKQFENLMSDKSKKVVFEGYCSRAVEMRAVTAMGFIVENGEDGVSYVNKM
jgi:hypothetical protein